MDVQCFVDHELLMLRSMIYVTVGCPSICPIDQQQQWLAARLLLSALRAVNIDG